MSPRGYIIKRFSSDRHRVNKHISETLQQIISCRKMVTENQLKKIKEEPGEEMTELEPSKKFGFSETAEMREEEKKPALGFLFQNSTK